MDIRAGVLIPVRVVVIMSMEEKRKLVDTMIGVCLGFLVREGLVRREDIDGKWYSRCDMDHRLDSTGFYGGASIDDIGRPVIVYHSQHTFAVLSHVLPHEAVHLAQICRGSWEPFQGYSIWEGQEFTNLSGDDPEYNSLEKQPWEHEAKQWEGRVRNDLLDKFPSLAGS